MNKVLLLNKSKFCYSELNTITKENINDITSDKDNKIITLEQFQKLYNLGYITEYQDYYIKII